MNLIFRLTFIILCLALASCQESVVEDTFHPGISNGEVGESVEFQSISSIQSGLINRNSQGSINFKLTFSGVVNVTGTPKIKVKIGDNTRLATYSTGTGTNELTFTYTLQASDLDLDGVEVHSPIDLSSGSIASSVTGRSLTPIYSDQSFPNLKIVFPDLTFWLDFSKPSTMRTGNDCSGTQVNANDSVGCVLDLSGNGLNAVMDTANFRPTYRENVLSGKSALTFDGSNDYLTIPHNSTFMNNITNYTAVIVFKPSSLGSPYGLLAKRVMSTNSTFSIFLHTSNYVYFDLPNDSQRNTTTSSVMANTSYYFSIVYDGSLASNLRGESFLNGSTESNGNGFATLTNTTTPVTIGTLNVGYGSYFPGHIGEILFFKRSLDKSANGELEVIHQYIAAKWGI